MKLIEIVEAAQLAYECEHEIKIKYTGCEFIDEGGTQLFIDENDDRVLISFRGTELKLEDWITDLDLTMHYGIHRGFNNALDDVWAEIAPYLHRGKPYYITGHSLGAALAGLCAMKISYDGVPDINVVTFGQPRMGDSQFASQYEHRLGDRTRRFVNNNDIVTRIPPRAMGYDHVGELQYFKENGELTTFIGEWYAFLDRVHGRIQDIGEWGFDGLKDHSIDEYVKLIRGYDDRNNKR